MSVQTEELHTILTGDSTEIEAALLKAEQGLQRYGKTVARTTAEFGDFEKRGRKIIDTTTQSLEASGGAARKAAVDYKRLAEESKRAHDNMNAAATRARKNSAAGFAPAPAGKYDSPDQQRVNALVDGVLRKQEFDAIERRFSRGGRNGGGGGGGGGGGDGPRTPRGLGSLLGLGGVGNAGAGLGGLGALGVGFGPAAGILAAVAATKKLIDVHKEGVASAKAFNRELSQRPSDVVGNLGQSAILEQLGRDRELEKTARKKGKFDDYVTRAADYIPFVSRARRAAAGGDVEENSDRFRRIGRERRAELEGSLVSRGARNVDIAREDASGSGRIAALRKAELETEEKIAAIQLNRNISKKTQAKLTEHENELLELQKEKINQASDAQERQYALSQKLNNLRAQGATEVQMAEAKVAAAIEDQAKAKGDAKKAATDALGTAVAELAVAQKTAALARIARAANLATSRLSARAAEASSATGSSEQRQRIALESQVSAAEALSAAAQERLKANKGNADAEADVTMAANDLRVAKAAVAQFERDTAFANEQQLKSAQATTSELQLHARGRETEAQKVAATAGYQAQIAQALRDGKTELAAQLQLQQQITLQAQRAAQLAKTPNERRNDRANQRRTERLYNLAGALDSDEADRHSRGARPTSGRNGIGYRSQLRDPRTSSIRSGSARLSDQDFRNQFKPLSQQAQQNREAVNAAKSAASKKDSGGKDNAVVKAINEVKTTMEKAWN